MVEINNISKHYESVKAVDEVNFSVKEGELFGVIGPDGAGKSTLFRMIISLIIPDAGEINMWGLNPVADYKEVRKMIGYMPGKFSLYYDLTIEENLEFFASVFGTTVEENYHLIKDIYSQIEPFKNRPAGKLSGGMKQKLALSCALIHKPRLLVLDEPTTGVDAVSRREFWEMLRLLKEKDITILVSTPYMDEAGMCDRVALMQKGKILDIDTPEHVTNKYKGRLFGLKGENNYQVLKHLKANNYHVYPFGEYIHLADEQEQFNVDSLQQELSKGGFVNCEVKQVKPDIEDRFIQLMAWHE